MLSNRSIPGCTVIPEIPYPDIDQAISWLCDCFGFKLRLRIGNHRAQMNVGDGAVVLTQSGSPDARSSCSIMVRVEDVDSHHQFVSRRAAHILSAPATHPYGERQYRVEDLAGHRWTFTQSVADVDPEEWGGTPGTL
jgi:uncharacterized glyoxalase superfamily protein PhnB